MDEVETAQLKQILGAAGVSLVTILGTKVVGKMVDDWWKPNVDELKLSDEYIEILEKSPLYKQTVLIEESEVSQASSDAAKNTESILDDASVIKSAIIEAGEALRIAEETTTCGFCKDSIQKARKAVVDNTYYLIAATDKSSAMRLLKTEGKLSNDAQWSGLSVAEKNMVTEKVEELRNSGKIQNPYGGTHGAD